MKLGAKVIGIAGVARAGKDTFAALSKSSKELEGLNVRSVAYADKLKEDCEGFLKQYCQVKNLANLTGDAKTAIRPFLVWYGCYMRSINPMHWVEQVSHKIFEDDDTDVFIVTDVRFKNEAEWVHSMGGSVIHVKRFQPKPYQSSLVPPANAEEAANDPMVDEIADIHVRWPTVTDSKLASLQFYVDDALKRARL